MVATLTTNWERIIPPQDCGVHLLLCVYNAQPGTYIQIAVGSPDAPAAAISSDATSVLRLYLPVRTALYMRSTVAGAQASVYPEMVDMYEPEEQQTRG